MATAKQSHIETLHRYFTEALITALEAGDPPAPTLSVIRSFLSDSGVKPVNDSPTHQRLARAFADLPFKDTDEPTATNQKAN